MRNGFGRVLAHYEQQNEEQAVAEDGASFDDTTQTVIEVPKRVTPLRGR
jgi:hypothetical protein